LIAHQAEEEEEAEGTVAAASKPAKKKVS